MFNSDTILHKIIKNHRIPVLRCRRSPMLQTACAVGTACCCKHNPTLQPEQTPRTPRIRGRAGRCSRAPCWSPPPRRAAQSRSLPDSPHPTPGRRQRRSGGGGGAQAVPAQYARRPRPAVAAAAARPAARSGTEPGGESGPARRGSQAERGRVWIAVPPPPPPPPHRRCLHTVYSRPQRHRLTRAPLVQHNSEPPGRHAPVHGTRFSVIFPLVPEQEITSECHGQPIVYWVCGSPPEGQTARQCM